MTRERWAIAPLRCYELGMQLRNAPPVPATPWLSADREAAVIAEFIAAATCNSTNWDRLRRGVAELAADRDRFSLPYLMDMSFEEFTRILGGAYERQGKLSVRYRTVIGVAQALSERSAVDLHALVSEPVRLSGADGLYKRLAAIPAFGQDPGQKKARVLVQELCRTGLVTPVDPGDVRPAVEYHLIRLYLRTERVAPRHTSDLERLSEGAVLPMPAITGLREAVELAMYHTSDAAEIPVYDLNTIEWQLGRSLCIRSRPRCGGPPIPDKPLIECVASLVENAGGRCPFADQCRARHDDGVAKLMEPQLSSKYDYY